MNTDEMAIIRDGKQEWVAIPLPGAEGVFIKVMKADVEMDRAVVKIRFEPGSKMPRHIHHCRAIAYTISGEWAYDEGSFGPGETAWEVAGNDHIAWSDKGAELFIVFDGLDGRYLDNFMEDGSIVKLDMLMLKALEGLTQAEVDQLDIMSLIEIVPAGS